MARKVSVSLAPAFGALLVDEPKSVPEKPQEPSPLLTQEEKDLAYLAVKALIEKFKLGVDLIQRPCNKERSNIYYSLGESRSFVTHNIKRSAVELLAELLGLTFEDLQLGAFIINNHMLLAQVKSAAGLNDLFQKPNSPGLRNRAVM